MSDRPILDWVRPILDWAIKNLIAIGGAFGGITLAQGLTLVQQILGIVCTLVVSVYTLLNTVKLIRELRK